MAKERREAPGRVRKSTTITIFLVAMLYGVAIMAALSNTVVFLALISAGQDARGSLAVGLLGWGIVLYVHHKLGWPPFGWPFSRPRQSEDT